MKRKINDYDDFQQAKAQLERLPYGYTLMAVSGKPTQESELEKWRRQNSFFHRSLVPAYSHAAGIDEHEAKLDLQRMFACVVEHKDHYEVESIAGMSNKRLADFIEQCQVWLMNNYGVIVEHINYGKTKKIDK